MSLAAVALAATLAASPSKLGPFIAANPFGTAQASLAKACPPLILWVAGANVPAAVADFRTRCAGGVTVLRVPLGLAAPYTTGADAASSADDSWNRISGKLAGIDSTQITWLEGPREEDGLPAWSEDATASAWAARYWARLADRMNAAGYAPLVGSIGPGLPALAGEQGPATTNPFCAITAEMKKKTYRWGWSYRALSTDLARDVTAEADGPLRYRRIATDCGLAGIPLVLTEAGQSGGWLSKGTTNETAMKWFEWLDFQTRLDGDVVGFALYQFGDTSALASYELGRLAPSLARYIESPPVCDAGDCTGSSPGTPTDGGERPSTSTMDTSSGGGSHSVSDDGSGCGCTSAAGALPLALLGGIALLFSRRRR